MSVDKKPPAKKSKPLTPKQKNLVALMPAVEAGKTTLYKAMLEAGYSKNTAKQQTGVVGQIRKNTKMQEALRKAGFTEDYLAEGIVDGTGAFDGKMKVVKETADGDETVKFVGKPDYNARARYYKLGAELLDAMPAKKQINADAGVEELLDDAEEDADYAEWNDGEEKKD